MWISSKGFSIIYQWVLSEPAVLLIRLLIWYYRRLNLGRHIPC